MCGSTARPRRRNSTARICEFRRRAIHAGENVVTAAFTALIAPGRREHHPLSRRQGQRRLPLHVARAVGRERALSLLRSARSQGAPDALADGAAPLAGVGQRHHASGSTRQRGVTTYRFRETDPLPTYLFAFAAGPWHEFTGGPRNTHLWVRASRAREVEVDSLQAQVALGALVAREVLRRAVSVPAISVHAVAGISIRRNGASRRHDVQ